MKTLAISDNDMINTLQQNLIYDFSNAAKNQSHIIVELILTKKRRGCRSIRLRLCSFREEKVNIETHTKLFNHYLSMCKKSIFSRGLEVDDNYICANDSVSDWLLMTWVKDFLQTYVPNSFFFSDTVYYSTIHM